MSLGCTLKCLKLLHVDVFFPTIYYAKVRLQAKSPLET